MARILMGKPVADAMVGKLAARVSGLRAAGITPALAIIRVGERDDDLSYERGALKRCDAVGIRVQGHVLPASCTQEDLMAVISQVNADSSVHGCLMFRPLPEHLDEDAACEALDPAKDVDGITGSSLFGVFANQPLGFPPCTADACMRMLDHYGVELSGSNVVVLGRSLVVGKPVSMMLQAENATVTMCHTRTRNLASICANADVLVAAVGRARTVGADFVREGQVVIDVGINWDEAAGRFCGDADFAAVEPIVGAITPVPGGVGSVTTAVLAAHVVEAAERACMHQGAAE